MTIPPSLFDTSLLFDLLDDGLILLKHTSKTDADVLWLNELAQSLLNCPKPSANAALSAVQVFGTLSDKILSTFHTNPTLCHTLYLNSTQVAGDVWQCQIKPIDKETCLVMLRDHTRMHHLEKMRTDFVGNVSHELRTPLTVILGFLENLTSADDLKPAHARGMKLMQEQAIRMNNLVNDLLMLSRLESDETKPMTAVDMPRLLMQVFDHAGANNQSDPQAGHLLNIHLDTDKHILGIESYLYSAVYNLVTNAIKYTPNGGEIDIIWEEVAGETHLSVIDNGIGIAQKHLSRLTERFYRVDNGRSRATGGTGLGLAIVKHVLNKHDARLEISSKQGQGTTFRIIFPKTSVIDGKVNTNKPRGH